MAKVCGRRTYRWPTEIARGARQNLFLLDGALCCDACHGRPTHSQRYAAGFLTASRDDHADAELREVLTERRTNLFAGMELPLWRGKWSSHFRRFSGRNVNKRAIPILSVNQFHSSATNESGVFAGVGRERRRWGASCIAHAHWQPLPPRSCVLRLRLVGDEALILLSEVFIHL